MSDVTKDLLEALKTLVRHAEKQGRSGKVYDNARAAIARAEAALAEPQPDAGPAMTRDDVIRMAKEAGFFPDWAIANCHAQLERLIEIARAEEREACAKVCDELAHEWRGANSRIVECSAAIRARGEKP